MGAPLSKFQRRTQRTLRVLAGWLVVGVVAAFFHWVVVRSLDAGASLNALLLLHLQRSFAWGLLGGGAYIFLLRDKLRAFPFFKAFAIMTSLVLLTVVLLHVLSSFGSSEQPIGRILAEPWLWAEFLYRAALMGATMVMVRLDDQFASGTSGFLLGRYFKPRQELRIFMFLDLRSSTAVAERIGDTHYFQLLNELYADITDPVIYSEGDIYQYVGDELSVTWDLRKGIKDQRCLRCFFAIKEKLAKRAAHYQKRYGFVPVFKAGFHYGQVTTGEIGQVKKQTVFSGDAVNTAAHIQAACNDYGVDVLLSKELLEVMDLPTGKWNTRDLGEAQLKGKRRNVRLYTVSPAS